MRKLLFYNLTSCLLLSFCTVISFPQKVKSGSKQQITNTKPKANPLDSKLIAAVKAENVEKVKKLLAQGANPNATDYDIGFRIPVLNVILNQTENPNTEREIALALINAGADVNGHGNTFYPPLLLADDVEVVRLLIKKGADVNYQSPRSGLVTPLHNAVSHPNIVSVLIESGAKLNQLDDEGKTPLLLAISRIDANDEEETARFTETIQILLESGADTKIKNSEGKTAIQLAKELILPKVIDLLQKADVKQN